MRARGARVRIAVSALSALALAACGGTRGLILGEEPGSSVADAGPAEEAGLDAGCAACTLTVVLTGESTTTEQGQPNETAYDDTCPGNQAVVGYQGTLTSSSVGLTLIGSLSAVCGSLALLGSSSDEATVGAGATLPVRGTVQVDPWTETCPVNQVVVGFSGRSGADLDQLALMCAPLLASAGGGGGTTLTLGLATTLPAAGGDGGSAFSNVTCPSGEVARGGLGYAGAWVDALALVCATPTLTP